MNKLTVIIVNWNTCQMTVECLESLYQHGVADCWNIVLVDNASTDDSVNVIRNRFPEVHLIVNNVNLGFAAANNQALNTFDSEYYLLLNSDTVILDEVIQNSISFLDTNSGVGAMGCRVLNADYTIQYTCSMFPSNLNLVLQLFGLDRFRWPHFFSRYQMKYWQRDCDKNVEVISGCYLLIRKTVIEDIGYLDENFFFFGEETDWCYRMLKKGWALKFSPVGNIIHYGGGSVNKMNYKRDLLLSNAIVRLHRKHYGLVNVLAVIFILYAFTVSRTFVWFIISQAKKTDFNIRRFKHFWNCLINYHLIYEQDKQCLLTKLNINS